MKMTQNQNSSLKIAEYFVGFALMTTTVLTVVFAIQSSLGTLWD